MACEESQARSVGGHQGSQVASRQRSQQQMLEAGRAAWGEAPLCCQPHFPAVPKGFPGTRDCSLLPASSETQSSRRGFPSPQAHRRHLEAAPRTGEAGGLLCRSAPSAACPGAHTWLLTCCPERHQLGAVKSLICFCGGEVLLLSEQPEPLGAGVPRS